MLLNYLYSTTASMCIGCIYVYTFKTYRWAYVLHNSFLKGKPIQGCIDNQLTIVLDSNRFLHIISILIATKRLYVSCYYVLRIIMFLPTIFVGVKINYLTIMNNFIKSTESSINYHFISYARVRNMY